LRRVDADVVAKHWMSLPLQERIHRLRWTDQTLVQRVRDVRQALVQSELACLRYGFCCHEEEGLPAVKLSLDNFDLGTETSDEAFWARPHFIESARFIEMVKAHLRQQPHRAQRPQILGNTPNSWQEFESQLMRLVALTMIDSYREEETASHSTASLDALTGAFEHPFEEDEEFPPSSIRASAKKSKAKRRPKRCPTKMKTLVPFSSNDAAGQQEPNDEDVFTEEDIMEEASTQDDAVMPSDRSNPQEDGTEEDVATGSDTDPGGAWTTMLRTKCKGRNAGRGGTCSIKDVAIAQDSISHEATAAQEELSPTPPTASEVGSQDLQEQAPATSTASEAGSQEACADLVVAPEVEHALDTSELYPQAQLVFQTRLRRPRSLQRGWRTADPSPERDDGSIVEPPRSGWQLCIGGAAAEPGDEDMSVGQFEVRESRSIHPTQMRTPSRTPSPSMTSSRHATNQPQLPSWNLCIEKVSTPKGDRANSQQWEEPETMLSDIDYEKQADMRPQTPREGDIQPAFSIPTVPWVFVPVPLDIPQAQAPGTWFTEDSFAGNTHCSEHMSLVADYSVGSVGHPHSCAAACKYARKPRGCKEGKMCDRCHLCFWRKGGNKEPQTPQVCGGQRRSRAISDEAQFHSLGAARSDAYHPARY